MKRPFIAMLAGVALVAARPAQAQMAVFDSANYAKLLQETQTALKQLQQAEQQVQQGQQLLTSLNQASNVNGLASVLEQPALRSFLPDAASLVTTAQADWTALGAIGANARAIRTSNQLYVAPSGSTVGADLMAAGDRAAVSLATGQAVVQAGASRLTGLQQLQGALDSAANARAVLDLQARAQLEQAMIANDQMRLQGVAMTQAAQVQVQTQRDQERAAAASQARLALYQAAFQ